MREPLRIALGFWLGLAPAALGARSSYAQEGSNERVRRELILRAQRARGAGDHREALDAATRSMEMRSSPSIEYFVAREHDALGHRDEAHRLATRCVRAAETEPALRDRDLLLRACASIVARTAPPVVAVPEPVPWPRPPVGAPAPAVFPALAQSRDRSPTLAPMPRPGGAPRPPVAGPWILGGAGLASVVASGVLFVVAAEAQRERDALCPAAPLHCDPAAVAFDDRYRAALVAGDVASIVGGAALLTGALWWTVPRVGHRAAAPVLVTVQRGGGAFALGARIAW
jgi:hypothetical protein